MPRVLSFLLMLLGGAGLASAQTVEVQPVELSRLPTSELGAGQYWQQLVLTLSSDDAPGDSTVSVDLPAQLTIKDTDADGLVVDEVRVGYAPIGVETPGFFASQASTLSRLVLSSSQPAAAGGRVYLQFPVSALPGTGGLSYGPVHFGDPREQDMEFGPALHYMAPEEFGALGSMDIVTFSEALAPGADTTTSAAGAVYPDVPEVLVPKLPDLVFDRGAATASNLVSFGDGDDGNDVQFRFFFSVDPNLDHLDPSAAVEATTASGEAYREHEGVGRPVQLSTRDLPEGTYYLYAISSELTGYLPLARSRGVRVQHAPQVLRIGPEEGDITLDSGNLYDQAGQASGQGAQRIALEYAALDYDDTAAVSLFYSLREDLGAADVQADAGVVTGLAGAALVAEDLREPQGSQVWDILQPQVVPAGDYFVYAVASDAVASAVRRSEYRVRVRHSPFLRLDPLDDQVLAGTDTISTGGPRPQRLVTITWGRNGRDGDMDVDENAGIDLYFSTTPCAAGGTTGFIVPGNGDDLVRDLGRNTFAIAEGLSEDPDGRGDNHYAWDLWDQARRGQAVPRVAQVYYLYGVIADSSVRRLVQMNNGRLNDAGSKLVFRHEPALRPRQPLADLVVRPGTSARVSWEAENLAGPAWVRVLLTTADRGSVSDYATLAAAGAYVANSADGAPPIQVDPQHDLGEEGGTGYLDLRVDHLRRSTSNQGPIQDGMYHVYLAIEERASFGATSLAWLAPGKIQVEGAGTAAGGGFRVFQLLPESFSLGAGERQRFELRADAGAAAVDMVVVTLRLDRKAFSVVDQDTVREGIQPFAVGADFAPAKVVLDEQTVAEDTTFLRFAYLDPTMPAIPLLDGKHALATLELTALEQPGLTTLSLAVDPTGPAGSHLENDGRAVLSPEGGALAKGTLMPGGAVLKGQVALEGRTDMSSAVTFSLRPWASHTALVDSAFTAANDADSGQDGVQVEVGTAGSFELSQVPAGRLDLYAHLDGYLDAWVPGLELYPNLVQEQLRPSSTGRAADSVMFGGDVAGYLDLDGRSLPDNEVSLADWDFVAASFAGGDSAPGDSGRADITGDGMVDIRDLALVGANFLREGPRPVYKPRARAAGTAVLRAGLEPGRPPVGQEITFDVTGEGVEGLRAWELELRFDPAEWTMLAAEPGSEASPVLVARREQPGAWRLAASLLGRDGDFSRSRPLARWRLQARRADPAPPVLEVVLLLDQADRPLQYRYLASVADRPLPQAALLRQNYPNPFNPQTTIAFAVPTGRREESAEVRLEIFDVLGQKVAALWQGPLEAGEYQVRWDGRDRFGRPVGSGIYFYRLQSGADRLVRRMSLVR